VAQIDRKELARLTEAFVNFGAVHTHQRVEEDDVPLDPVAAFNLLVVQLREFVDVVESAIRDYLKDEAGYLESSSDKRIKGRSMSCMVFDTQKCRKVLKDITGLSELVGALSEGNSDS
jgi:hypothetical protein